MNNEQQPTQITNKPPHPHAHWIKLWSDGVPIEYKAESGQWIDVIQFSTLTPPDLEYRIKPSNEPWKPRVGDVYYFVEDYLAKARVSKRKWNDSFVDRGLRENNNCFRTYEEAEAAAERVKDALKGGNSTGSKEAPQQQLEVKDAEIKALKEEIESLRTRCENLQITKERLISSRAEVDALTDGELALIKAIRVYPIEGVFWKKDSILVCKDDMGILQTKFAHISLWSSRVFISKDLPLIKALKQIKAEQDAKNEAK